MNQLSGRSGFGANSICHILLKAIACEKSSCMEQTAVKCTGYMHERVHGEGDILGMHHVHATSLSLYVPLVGGASRCWCSMGRQDPP